MSEPQRLEDGPVDSQDGPVGNGKREADLSVQRQEVVVPQPDRSEVTCGHRTSVPESIGHERIVYEEFSRCASPARPAMQFDIRTSATRTCAPTPIARSVANTEPSGATRFTGQILHQFPIRSSGDDSAWAGGSARCSVSRSTAGIPDGNGSGNGESRSWANHHRHRRCIDAVHRRCARHWPSGTSRT